MLKLSVVRPSVINGFGKRKLHKLESCDLNCYGNADSLTPHHIQFRSSQNHSSLQPAFGCLSLKI